ncbi:MAG: hypothetical protein J6W08_01225 [Alphaproteobacteria bacterium]|nr:hypothetical protein [Alphaproteobacteria bacterium]MBR0212513.1 hypothetical protein [Alphaproteobacteria bacterium]
MHYHYYYQKYPYLNYNFRDTDGLYRMFSIPPKMLAAEFENTFSYRPKTFFDCGAATGVIVWLALRAGMDARGIDIKKYPYQFSCYDELFRNGNIQIKSILDCEPIVADIVFCNGTLTYFSEKELPKVLDKFRNSKMICAIHNTTEDVEAATANGDELTTCNKTRLIKPQNWWMDTFTKKGFNTKYAEHIRCFCAVPSHGA